MSFSWVSGDDVDSPLQNHAWEACAQSLNILASGVDMEGKPLAPDGASAMWTGVFCFLKATSNSSRRISDSTATIAIVRVVSVEPTG